jgi:hypothetical protein
MKKIFLSFAAMALILGACNENKEKAATTATENNAANGSATNAPNTSVINNTNTASTQQVDPSKLAGITFEKYDHNFGKVKEGDKVAYTFKFKNTGANDLIISDARGSCGCTVPQWPKEPVKPGAEGEIKVEYDSKGKNGVQNKTVSITANTNPSITTLNITTEVIANADASAKK